MKKDKIPTGYLCIDEYSKRKSETINIMTKKEAKKKMKDMGFGTYQPLGFGFRELDKELLNFRKKLLKILMEGKVLSKKMKIESLVIIFLCEKAKVILTEQLEKANLN